MSKDYEVKTEHSESFFQMAMIRLMLNLLPENFKQPLRQLYFFVRETVRKLRFGMLIQTFGVVGEMPFSSAFVS